MFFNGLFGRSVYSMVLFCGLASPACSQITIQLDPKQRRVSLIADHAGLGAVLEQLFEAGMPLYYSTEYIPVDSTVSFHIKDMTWDNFIDLLCQKAHLKNTILGNHYVLHYIASDEPADLPDIPANSLNPGEPGNSEQPPAPALIHLPVISQRRYDPHVLPVLSPSTPLSPSRSVRWHLVSLALVYGPNFPTYYFKAGLTPDQYFETGYNYIGGIMTGFSTPLKRLQFNSGLKYLTSNFSFVYNYRILDPADPFPIAGKTDVKTVWIQVPVKADYLVWRRHRFIGLLTAGLFTRYKISDKETTRYLNASDRETDLYLSPIRSFSLGAILGSGLTFSLFSAWKVMLSLEYMQSFHRLNPQAMKLAMTEVCLQAGIKYSFH